MAYWWVFQNKTYEHERDGGYLWAPLRNRAGNIEAHWESMDDVRPGDVVFCCVDQKIVAVAVAQAEARVSQRPREFEAEDVWEAEGRRVDVAYTDLTPPVEVGPLSQRLLLVMPEKYAPSTGSGRVTQDTYSG